MKVANDWELCMNQDIYQSGHWLQSENLHLCQWSVAVLLSDLCSFSPNFDK